MKKSMIYTLLALFVWTMAVPAAAQKKRNPKELKALETVMDVMYTRDAKDAKTFVETEIYPQFKKNPYVLKEIGYGFASLVKDTATAIIYIDRALAADPKYVPAYVGKGNVLLCSSKTNKEVEAVYKLYDKAISLEPKNPLGYRAYADALAKKHDYDGAEKKWKEILQHVPDYNVYAEIGTMYALADGLESVNKAVEAYAKADMSRMTSGQIAGYVMLLQAVGKAGQNGAYVRSDSLLTVALKKYPTDAKLNRLMMKNSVTMQKYDQAIAAADVLFNKSDSAEIVPDDFLTYGKAYEGLKNYDAAIEQYGKCRDFEVLRYMYKSAADFESIMRREDKLKNTAWQAIAKAYAASGRVDKAIEEQKKFIEHRREEGKLDAPELFQLTKFYESQAEESTGADKAALYKKAYDVLGEMAEISPVNAVIAYYGRLAMVSKIDDGLKDGLAVPDAEKIIELIPFDEKLDSRNKTILETSVEYLVAYYLKKEPTDYENCVKYTKMLGKINPKHNLYLKIMEIPSLRKRVEL